MFSKPSNPSDRSSNSDVANENLDGNAPSSKQIEHKFNELKALISSSDTSAALHELSEVEIQYRICLMENISEGVIFVNHENEITCWNRSAESITGLSSSNMIGEQFTPGIIGLNDVADKQQSVPCPVAACLETRQQSSKEYGLIGKSGRQVNIELTTVPVIHAMQCHGVVVLLNDQSANKHLKEQLKDLKNSSSLDPLTRVANRAEFEKQLREYVVAHRATGSKCSLIIGDIDFFKMVNDTYGHNVGDQALIAFAQSLQEFVRSRDIVARYGGEEFVVLCANCDLENAMNRAEQIRQNLNRTPQSMLDGKTLSASFGVAELNDIEDATAFFVRADKALYAAKQNGRNRVEAASETKKVDKPKKNSKIEKSSATGIEWRKISKGSLYCEEFCTSTPAELLADKLRGFINEGNTRIRKIKPQYASIYAWVSDPKRKSKTSEFRVDIEFKENDEASNGQKQTFIRITIFPPVKKMFRRSHEDLYPFLVTDIRRFFMINDDAAIVKLNLAATSSGRD